MPRVATGAGQHPPAAGAPAAGGPGGPFSTAPLPASPQNSPELFTPPGAAAPSGAPGQFATDVDADSDVPSGPPSQADEGETDESSE